MHCSMHSSRERWSRLKKKSREDDMQKLFRPDWREISPITTHFSIFCHVNIPDPHSPMHPRTCPKWLSNGTQYHVLLNRSIKKKTRKTYNLFRWRCWMQFIWRVGYRFHHYHVAARQFVDRRTSYQLSHFYEPAKTSQNRASLPSRVPLRTTFCCKNRLLRTVVRGALRRVSMDRSSLLHPSLPGEQMQLCPKGKLRIKPKSLAQHHE